jgi:hypothetical protein
VFYSSRGLQEVAWCFVFFSFFGFSVFESCFDLIRESQSRRHSFTPTLLLQGGLNEALHYAGTVE